MAGNYWYARSFGLYEDDYFFTIQAYGWDWANCWAHIKDAFLSWPQGRPVGFAFTHFFGWLTSRADSLMPGYALGAAILFTNAALLWRLAGRLLPAVPALVVAGVYCLYPVDASRMILMHRAFQLLNFTFLLLAFHAYVRGGRILPYIFAACSLLTYESFFFPFLLAPLFVRHPREVRVLRWVIHVAVCAGVVGLALVTRKHLGDSRLGEVFGSTQEVIGRVIKSMGIGPWTAAKESVLRIAEALRHSDFLQWSLIIGAIGVVFALHPIAPDQPANARPDAADKTTPAWNYAWLLAVSLVTMAVGYVLAFRPDNYPPVATIGRLSGFVAAGSLGAAFAVGSLFALLELGWKGRHVSRLLAGLVLGCLVSFGLEMQRTDYVQSWIQQKEFWQPVLATSGEWTPGVPVIVNVEGHGGAIETPGFPAAWTVNSAPMLAPYVFNYPPEWAANDKEPETRQPRVYGYSLGMKSTDSGADRIILVAPPWADKSLWPLLANGRFIYFGYIQGQLRRIDTPIVLDGHTLTPKARPEVTPSSLPPSKLYRMLFEPPSYWPTFGRAYSYPH